MKEQLEEQREEKVVPPPVRRRRWILGLACFGLGLAAMWGLQHVDVLSIFRSGTASPDELARGAFEALHDGDDDAFDAYLAGVDVFERYAARIREVGSDRDRRRVEESIERDGGLAAVSAKYRRRARSTFAETMDRCGRAGLDWSNAVYEGLNQERTRIQERYGWRGGDVHFVVRSGGETFDFKLDDCMCVDGDWMIGSGVFLIRRRTRAPDRDSRPKAVPVEPESVDESEAAAPVAVPEIELPKDSGR